jgi:hypothetical protein
MWHSTALDGTKNRHELALTRSFWHWTALLDIGRH